MEVISIADSEVEEDFIATAKESQNEYISPHKSQIEVLTLNSFESSEEKNPTSKESLSDSKLPLLNEETFCSPSPKSKVSVWLFENSIEDFIPGVEEPSLIDSDVILSSLDEFSSLTSENKPTILVRQDYNKSNGSVVYNKNLNFVRPSPIYIDSDSDSSIICNNLPREKLLGTPLSARNLHGFVKCVTNLCSDGSLDSSKEREQTEVAISPETQKKNELCEYLKLMNMNCTDRTIINMRQNRRSSRVQHLAVMSEKKELEKKLSEERRREEKNTNVKKYKRSVSTDLSSKTLSSKRQNSTESSIVSKERSSNNTSDETPPKRYFRTKYLQVPEISTTSASKNNKNIGNITKILAESSLNNAKKVKLSVKNSLKFNFVYSLPKVYSLESDFEESIKSVLGDRLKCKIEQEAKKETKAKKFSFKKHSVSKLRSLIKPSQKKDFKKTKRLKEKIKKFKQSSRLNHFKQLRSRGLLKRVPINSLLSKTEKRTVKKKVKQKPKKLSKANSSVAKPKEAKLSEAEPSVAEQNEVEKIKSAKSQSSKDVDLLFNTNLTTKTIDLKDFETKINQLNSEINYLNDLTPEHVRSLAESQKYINLVIEYPLVDQQSGSFPETNSNEGILSCASFDLMQQGVHYDVLDSNIEVITSEDLEVDQLMNRKKNNRKDGNKTLEDNILVNVDDDDDDESSSLNDERRSTLISMHSACSSCSLQSVENNTLGEPSTSASNTEHLSTTERAEADDNLIEISSSTNEVEVMTTVEPEVINIAQIQPTTCKYTNPSLEAEVKSLHHYLTMTPKKVDEKCRANSPNSQQNWDEHFKSQKLLQPNKKSSQSHTVQLSKNNGAVLNAYYVDHNLIVVQELLVSFWNQTPLGNILGAQNMWISKNGAKRIVLSNGCIPIESAEMVTSADNSVAYFELWIKEHKSEKRERPVADIFVVTYFRNRNGADKKVLQLENIHGYSNDVQYIVLRNSSSIVVTWNVIDDKESSTIIHCYQLSPDYQTVTGIQKMQSIGHYVSSLHNIQDCDNLIVGCGNGKLTLCNIEYGYVVATIDLTEALQQPQVLWAKCDRGFLFTLHQLPDKSLQLIAINSFDSTWKKLQTYKPIAGYSNLLGACLENGILVAFYDNGVLCWYAQSSDLIIEDAVEDTVFMPFGKYVTVLVNNEVNVRHALAYVVCED